MRAETPTPRRPRFPAANAVTLLRVLLVPAVAVLVAQTSTTARWWALAVFLFAAFTDLLDGYVARRMHGGVTRWGQLADPLADKLLIIGCLVVLAWNAEIPWWAVVIIGIREVAITLQRSVLSRRGVTMPADKFGKAKTLAQIIFISLVLMPLVPGLLETIWLWIAVGLTVGSGLAYARRGLSA